MLGRALLLRAAALAAVLPFGLAAQFISPSVNSTVDFAGQLFHLEYYGANGNSSISNYAQVTITTMAFGTEASGLNTSKVHGYSLSQPMNLATIYPNGFQPDTSEEDRAAFRYNAYDYNLSLASQPLDISNGSTVDGFLTVLEAYTVPSTVNGLLWTNRATLPVRLFKSNH